MLIRGFLKRFVFVISTIFLISSCSVNVSRVGEDFPVISVQPSDLVVCNTDGLTEILFSIEAEGSDLEYQWFLSDGTKDRTVEEALTAVVESGKDIELKSSDENLDIYYAKGITAIIDLNVYVVVSNKFGSVNSETAKLQIVDCEGKFGVTLDDKTAAEGESVTFQAQVTGSKNVSYSWYYWVGDAWGALAGTDSTYTVDKVDSKMNGAQIKVVVLNNDDGTSAEAIAVLTVTGLFKVEIPDVNIKSGETATFIVQTYNVVGKLSFEWFMYAADIPLKIDGATGSSYTTGPMLADTKFRVCATDDVLATTYCDSGMVYIQVVKPLSVSLGQINTTVGSDVTFTGSAKEGVAPYTYKWYEKNSEGTFDLMPGYDTTTLFIPAVTLADNNRQFRFCATDSAPTEACAEAGLFVTEPVYEVILASITANVGDTVIFTPTIKNGSPPYIYEWYRDGVKLESETGSTLTLVGVTVADNGAEIDVCITDTSHPRTCSETAILTIK